MRTRVIGIAAWAALSMGCSKAKAPGDADQGADTRRVPAAVTPEEVAPLKSKLDAALAANASRSCPRPVLFGEPKPGRADTEIRAIMEPSPALQECFDAVGREGEDVPQSCTLLPAAVRAAVAHEDACSPYLLGRNPFPDSLLPYIRTAEGLVSLGDARLEAGNPHEAFRAWLDGIRLGQDLARGGATWLEAMVAHAGGMILIDHAHQAVDEADMTDAQLGELQAAVVTLVESEPHPRTHMLADRFYPLLYDVAPPLLPEAWEPPGGFPPDKTRPESVPPAEQRRLLITWETLERLAAKQAKACPADTDVATCLRGIEELVVQLVDGEKLGTDDVRGIIDDPQGASDAFIASSLEAMAAPSWSKYLERQAQRRVALHALALRLGVRRGEPCPDAESQRLVVPGLGESLRAAPAEHAVVLSAPPSVGGDEPLQWTVQCPEG